MTAKIIVLTGPAGGREHIIREHVMRIGSDPACGLQLPGLSAHAVTVRFSDGAYNVFNRSGRDIDLEGQAVKENSSAVWEHGQDLQISQETLIQLQVDGDPAPRAAGDSVVFRAATIEEVDEPAPANPDQDDVSDEPGPSPEQTAAAKTRNQMLLLGGLALAFVGLLVASEMKSSTVGSAQGPGALHLETLTAQIDELNKRPETTPDLREYWQDIRTKLQDARIAENSGRAAAARDMYAKLRQKLHARPRSSAPATSAQSQTPAPDEKLFREIDQFILQRVSALTGNSI